MMNLAELVVRPSGLELTNACPGSLQLQATVPPVPETEEEAEGVFAHWVALRYAAGYGSELPVGTVVPNFRGRDWTVDSEMVTGARIYLRALGGTHNALRLEDPVDIPRIHAQCRGTPDAWRYALDARELYLECPPEMPADLFAAGKLKILRVGDYKYGHRYVEAYWNAQCSGYLAGVMKRLNITDNDEGLWVEIVIVQPRNYHADGPVRIWRCEAPTLRAILNISASAAREAVEPNPRCIVNRHCIDCTARHVCKTLQYSTMALVDFSSTAEVVELPAEAIGQELALVEEAIARLEARQTGLAAQADTLIRSGKAVALYHLEPGQSRLTYLPNLKPEEIIGLGDLLGIDLRKPQTIKDLVVTPTQAIDLGIERETMKAYANRPPAALKLKRDDTLTARKVFAK